MKVLLLCVLLYLSVSCIDAFFNRRSSSSRSRAAAAPNEKVEEVLADDGEEGMPWEMELALAARQNWGRDEAYIRDKLREAHSTFKFYKQRIAKDVDTLRKLEKKVQTLYEAVAMEEETAPTQENYQEHDSTDQKQACIFRPAQELEFVKDELEWTREFLSSTHASSADTQSKIEKLTNDLNIKRQKLKRVDSMLPYTWVLAMRMHAFAEKRTGHVLYLERD